MKKKHVRFKSYLRADLSIDTLSGRVSIDWLKRSFINHKFEALKNWDNADYELNLLFQKVKIYCEENNLIMWWSWYILSILTGCERLAMCAYQL